MKDTTYYLDRICDLTDTGSDYAGAKLLGISRQAMSKYRNGRMTIDGDAALRFGELLGVDPVEILLHIKATKARDGAARRAWIELAKKHSGRAASLILGLCLIGASSAFLSKNQAVASMPTFDRVVDQTIHYAQLFAGLVGRFLHRLSLQSRRAELSFG